MTSSPTPSLSRPRPLVLSLIPYTTLFVAFALAALQMPASEAKGPIFFSALTGSAVAIFLVWSFSDSKNDDRSLRNLIFAGMVVDVLFNYAATRPSIAATSPLLSPALIGIGNLGMLAAAIGVGLFLGRGLKQPTYLVVAAVAGALTDIVSVYGGPSKHISVSHFFDYLSFQWGVLGHSSVHPIIGAGDFIFLTLYFFGSRKFGLDDRKTLWAMISAIATGFWVTLYVGAVPALPFMSVALLLTHGRALWQQIRLNRSEVDLS